MTIQAQVAGLGTLEFPDGTDPSVIQQTVLREIGKSQAPRDAKPPSAAAELGSAFVRPLAKGIAALPLMAMDAGVAARNIGGDIANKLAGRPATKDYELPSTMFNRSLDAVTVAPTGIGKAAEFVSSSLVGGKLGVPEVPAVPKVVAPAVAAARQAGYVLPPGQAGGGFWARLAEGASGGKVKTAQLASLKNQPVTNSLVRSSLGMAPDTPITVEALEKIRQGAGKAYEAVRGVDGISTDGTFQRELAAIGQKYGSSTAAFGREAEHPVTALVRRLSAVKDFSGDEAINEIGMLREEAEKAAASRDKGLASALRRAAGAIEEQVERHLEQTPEHAPLVENFRNARQLIAKTYSVQKALDRATGDVSAQKLATQLAANKPLSGEIRTAARFGTAFRKSAQTPAQTGSVTHFSPLDTAVMGMEGATALTAAIAAGNYKAAAAAAGAMALQASRPAVRAALLSKTGQKLAIEGAPRAAAATKALTLAGIEQSETQ